MRSLCRSRWKLSVSMLPRGLSVAAQSVASKRGFALPVCFSVLPLTITDLAIKMGVYQAGDAA